MVVQPTSAAATARIKLSSPQPIPPEPQSKPAQNPGPRPSADAPGEPAAPTPPWPQRWTVGGREQEVKQQDNRGRECHPGSRQKHPNANVYHFRQHLSQASNHYSQGNGWFSPLYLLQGWPAASLSHRRSKAEGPLVSSGLTPCLKAPRCV